LTGLFTIFGITGGLVASGKFLTKHLRLNDNDPEETEATEHQNCNPRGKAKTFFLSMAKCGAFVGTMMDKTTNIFFYFSGKFISQKTRNKRGLLLIEVIKNGGNINQIRTLIRLGANINAQDKYGKTPLHWVVAKDMAHNKIDMVLLLLKNGRANINIQDDDGMTPLHWAVSRDQTDIIPLLLDYDTSSINAKNKYGFTPIHLAVLNNKENIVSLFLDHGLIFIY
jgi:Ankyrin repeats (3 copies)